jgi:hypothetical protein
MRYERNAIICRGASGAKTVDLATLFAAHRDFRAGWSAPAKRADQTDQRVVISFEIVVPGRCAFLPCVAKGRSVRFMRDGSLRIDGAIFTV